MLKFNFQDFNNEQMFRRYKQMKILIKFILKFTNSKNCSKNL